MKFQVDDLVQDYETLYVELLYVVVLVLVLDVDEDDEDDDDDEVVDAVIFVHEIGDYLEQFDQDELIIVVEEEVFDGVVDVEEASYLVGTEDAVQSLINFMKKQRSIINIYSYFKCLLFIAAINCIQTLRDETM